VRAWIGLNSLRMGSGSVSCGRCCEPYDYIKGGKFFDCLGDCCVLRRESCSMELVVTFF